MSKNYENYFSKLKGSSVLITGGLGFIGSNLAHFLVEIGAKVTIVDSLVKTCGGNIHNIDSINKKVTVLNIDLRDTKKIQNVLKGKDFIFNIAGRSTHKSGMQNPLLDSSINSLSHLSLLEAYRKAGCNAKIIYAGTRTQYGKITKNPVSETAPLNPVDFNGLHHTFAEMYHMFYHKNYGIAVCSLRLSNTYGPKQVMNGDELGVLPLFLKKAMDGETININGKGNNVRDFVFVSDVVNALCLAAVNPKSSGQIFNVGSGNPATLKEIANQILKLCPSGKVEYRIMPKEYAKIEIGDYVADISKIKKTLGWQPSVKLTEGLKKTHDFFVKNKRFYW